MPFQLASFDVLPETDTAADSQKYRWAHLHTHTLHTNSTHAPHSQRYRWALPTHPPHPPANNLHTPYLRNLPPSLSPVFSFPLLEGDVVLLGTDGLFDNLFDDQLVALVQSFLGGMRSEVRGGGQGAHRTPHPTTR